MGVRPSSQGPFVQGDFERISSARSIYLETGGANIISLCRISGLFLKFIEDIIS